MTFKRLGSQFTMEDVFKDPAKARDVLRTMTYREINGLGRPMLDPYWSHFTWGDGLKNPDIVLPQQRNAVKPYFYDRQKNPITHYHNNVSMLEQIRKLEEARVFGPLSSQPEAKELGQQADDILQQFHNLPDDGSATQFRELIKPVEAKINFKGTGIPADIAGNETIPTLEQSRKHPTKPILTIIPSYQRRIGETSAETATSNHAELEQSRGVQAQSILQRAKEANTEELPVSPNRYEDFKDEDLISALSTTARTEKDGTITRQESFSLKKNAKKILREQEAWVNNTVNNVLNPNSSDMDKQVAMISLISEIKDLLKWDAQGKLAGVDLDAIKARDVTQGDQKPLVRTLLALRTVSNSDYAYLLQTLPKPSDEISKLADKARQVAQLKGVTSREHEQVYSEIREAINQLLNKSNNPG